MENHFFFLLGLAFILVHEMDAVRSREWAIFPLLSRLDENTGYYVFTALHVPLYLLLFWSLFSTGELNRSLVIGLDIFFIVHVFLHLLFSKNPRNDFKSKFSWVIMLGSGIAGLLDLVVGF